MYSNAEVKKSFNYITYKESLYFQYKSEYSWTKNKITL